MSLAVVAEQELGRFDVLWRLAQRLSPTEFVPSGLRNRPEAVLACILSGEERGLGPMESLRSINVIDGRPSLSAEAMRALVLAAGHSIEIVESSAVAATVIGTRRESDRTSPPFTWTIDRARRAGLVGRQNWQKYPDAMLLARASADLCRAVFPDVVAGLAAVEETEGGADPAPAVSRKRTPPPPRRLSGTAEAERAAIVPAPEVPPSGRGARSAPDPEARGATVPSEAEVAGPPPVHPPRSGPVEDDASLLAGPAPWAPAAAVVPPEAPEVEGGTSTPEAPIDALQRRKLNAQLRDTFEGADRATLDRRRHALVGYVTRDRAGGPVGSSNDLTTAEWLDLSAVLLDVQAGRASVTDGPNGHTEVRRGDRLYVVHLFPMAVEVPLDEGA